MPYLRTIEGFTGYANTRIVWAVGILDIRGAFDTWLKFLAMGGAISLAVILVSLLLGERIKTVATLAVARKHSALPAGDNPMQERAKNPLRKSAGQGR